MPSGKVHAAISATNLLAVAAIGAPLALAYPDLRGPYLATLTIGLLVTPDLDIQGITHEEKRALRVPVIGWLWVLLWWPYALLVPHRSPVSHWPLIGTALRAVWLGLIVAAADAMLRPQATAIDTGLLTLGLWTMLGWAVQDMCHWVADRMMRGG